MFALLTCLQESWFSDHIWEFFGKHAKMGRLPGAPLSGAMLREAAPSSARLSAPRETGTCLLCAKTSSLDSFKTITIWIFLCSTMQIFG